MRKYLPALRALEDSLDTSSCAFITYFVFLKSMALVAMLIKNIVWIVPAMIRVRTTGNELHARFAFAEEETESSSRYIQPASSSARYDFGPSVWISNRGSVSEAHKRLAREVVLKGLDGRNKRKEMEANLKDELEKAGLKSVSDRSLKVLVFAAKQDLGLCGAHQSAALRREIIASLPFEDRSIRREKLY